MTVKSVLIILLHTVLIHLHLANIWVKESQHTAITEAMIADVVENVLVLLVEDTTALEAVVDLGLVNKHFIIKSSQINMDNCQEVKFL